MLPTRSWPGVSSLREDPQLQASEMQSKSTDWISRLRSMVRPFGLHRSFRALGAISLYEVYNIFGSASSQIFFTDPFSEKTKFHFLCR